MDSKRLKYLTIFRAECDEHFAQLSDALLRLEAAPRDDEAIKQALRVAHTIKGSAQLLGLADIAREAHALEEKMRPLEKAEGGGARGGDELFRSLDVIRQQVSELLPPPRTPGSIPPGTFSPASGTPTPRSAESRPTPVPRTMEIAPTSGRLGSTIRVPVEKVDALLSSAGELALGRARLERAVAQLRALFARRRSEKGDPLVRELRGLYETLSQAVGELDLAVRDVQDLTLSMRLLPCSTLFGEYPRAMRDLARELGKQARLELEGGDTECDKDLLDAVREPLVHLLRNCVDHGIESPEVRLAAGKPPQGIITLRAAQRGPTLLLEVSDDGAGIDLGAVRAAAVRLGQVSAEAAAQMSDSEAAYLITLSGLTTRGRATDTSGRGIGMEVVRQTVAALKGDLVIESDAGRGTRYLLSLPISLATMKVLLVSCDGRLYAIPLAAVELTLRIDPEKHPSLAETGTVLFRGRHLRLVWLRELVGLDPTPRAPGERLSIVALHHGGQILGLVADELLRDDEVVIKPLPMSEEVSPFVSGATLLGDGVLALILAVPRLFAAVTERAAPAPHSALQLLGPAEPARKSVLVVDDSFTTRLLEQNILEGSGYEVEVATSAESALELLRARRYDLLVTDVQMPGMSGFDLLERIRTDRRHLGMPCIVVTSVGDDTERELGRRLGAQAYIVKGDFEQETLLSAVEQLIGR